MAFVGLGAGQRPPEGKAVQGAHQVQSEAPEVAGVGGAIAILGPARQVGAFHRFAGAGTFDGGGIDDDDVVGCNARQVAQSGDQPCHGPGQFAEAFVVAGLLGDVGEHSAEVLVGAA